MDHKSWLWKKRSAEKTLPADKANTSSRRNVEDDEKEATEIRELMTEKAELERDLRMLRDEHSLIVSECNNKDNLVKKQIKIAQEAVEGWENARKESISLKKDLEEALQQKTACEERLSQLDAALKECMKQLCFVRDDQEKRIHDAVVKASEDFEKRRNDLEENVSEMRRMIVKLDAENTQMRKSVLEKDKAIEELNSYRNEMDADVNALMLRVQSTEKENASLKYEVCVLEKEIEIRNEEREFNRRMVGVAQKKQQESDKKIAKLEHECQKLRLLVKKKLPGAADLAKMKREVEILGVNQDRRRRSNLSLINSVEFQEGNDTPSGKIEFLMEQLHVTEEENRSLKHDLEKKSSEIQSLYSNKSSRSSQGQGKFKNTLKGHINKEKSTYPIRSLAATLDVCDDDEVSCTESWASALISEFEQFKSEKEFHTPSRRNITASEINLMDDFTEMEKLAVVSVDYTAEGSHISSDEGNDTFVGSLDMLSNTKKKAQKQLSNVSESINKILELLLGINIASQEKSSSHALPGKSDKCLDIKNGSNSSMGYFVRVFQWKAAEISSVLQLLIQTCNNLLNGTGDLEQFAQVIASSLEWIMNHCFSIQDVSTMKDRIISHLDWDETVSETEIETGLANHSAECSQLSMPYASMVSPLSDHSTKQCDENNKRHSIINSGGRNESQIENLRSRMRSMRLQTADQTKDQTMIKQDFDTYHSETNPESREVSEDISNLEDEENNRSNSSKIPKEIKVIREDADDGKHKAKEHQNQDWEITAASEKLAECQETLRNLGIQLMALASSEEASSLNEVISTPSDPVVTSILTPKTNNSERFSLLDKMGEEENVKTGALSIIKGDAQLGNADSTVSSNTATESWNIFNTSNEMDGDAEKVVVAASLAIVLLKKKNGTVSFLKKLFRRKKRSSNRKTPFS